MYSPLSQLYLFNQGDVAYFSSQHLPYACLATFFLIIFNVLLVLLLFIYPYSCFQVCLNHTGLRCQSLHIFMDPFQGHYKNGTNGTYDFRYFSALYLLSRILVYASLMFAYQVGSYASTTVIVVCFTAIIALAQPYIKQSHNFIDTLSLVMLTGSYTHFLASKRIGDSPLKAKSVILFNCILLMFLVIYLPVLSCPYLLPFKIHVLPRLILVTNYACIWVHNSLYCCLNDIHNEIQCIGVGTRGAEGAAAPQYFAMNAGFLPHAFAKSMSVITGVTLAPPKSKRFLRQCSASDSKQGSDCVMDSEGIHSQSEHELCTLRHISLVSNFVLYYPYIPQNS